MGRSLDLLRLFLIVWKISYSLPFSLRLLLPPLRLVWQARHFNPVTRANLFVASKVLRHNNRMKKLRIMLSLYSN